MHPHRRQFLRGLLTVAGAAGASSAAAQHQHPAPSAPRRGGTRARRRRAVACRDARRPPDAVANGRGVKEFRLVAEPVKTEFLPGRHVDAWGFNGHMPGPTIEITEGERVRFVVHNKLPEPFSMHWHGLEVPIEMDGVPGHLARRRSRRAARSSTSSTLHQHGTFFYHSHMAMQEMMGMVGLFIVHPQQCPTRRAWTAISALILQGVGASCRTTPSRTRWRWSSTG